MRKLFLIVFFLLSFACHAQQQMIIGTRAQTQPSEVPPAEDPYVLVDDRVLGDQGYQHNYTGTFSYNESIANWYNNSLTYSNTTNDQVELTFNGTLIEWYTETASHLGIVDVYIDDVLDESVDLYAASGTQQVLVYTSATLSQAVHTIKLVCTGTKNASSSNDYLIHDFFKIFNPQDVPETPDPTPYDRFFAVGGVNTGDCSNEGSPCATLTYTLSQSVSGDKVKGGAGTFIEPSGVNVPAGVSIWGAGMDQTIIKVDASYNNNNSALNSALFLLKYGGGGAGDQTLKDLTIEGNNRMVHGGVYIERSNVDADNVKITSFDYCGLYMKGDGCNWTNSEMENSGKSLAGFETGAVMIDAVDDFVADNFNVNENEGYCVKAFGGNPIILRHIWRNSEFTNVVINPSGRRGIAYEIHNSYPRDCEFYNNTVYGSVSLIRPTGFDDDGNNTFHIYNNTFDMISRSSDGFAVAAPLELGVHNATVENNHFVGGRFAYIVHWNSAETEAAVGWVIKFNTFYCVYHVNNPTPIVRSNFAPIVDCDIDNNTVHIPPGSNYHTNLIQTGSGSGGEANNDVRVRNNIIYDQSTCDCGVGGANVLVRGEGSGNTYTSCVFSNNIVNGMSTTLPSGWTTSNTLTGAPGLIGSGVNATPFISDPFYRPDTGSIAIESGVDIGYPFTGSAPTRGRYEQN